MPNIAIFCFSGTGNTYFVAKAICDALRASATCDLFALETHLDDANELVEAYDIIGLGYPIYGSSLPPLVFRFLDQLTMHHKQAFTFCTQLLFSGDGAAYGGRQLKKKGFDIVWQEHFLMPNNITDLRILDRKKAYDFVAIERSVAKRANRFATWILSGKHHKKGSNVGSLLLGLLQRIPFEAIRPAVMSNLIRIDSDRCVKCGACVALCPVSNLQFTDDQIIPQHRCTLCYRCVNHCPTNAIRLFGKSHVRNPYHGPSKSDIIGRIAMDDVQSNQSQKF